MELYVVEGNSQKLDGGAMFGNAPKALWSRWLVADDLNRIDLACRCLLLKLDDGRHVLFEAGIGNFFDPALKSRYGVVEDEHCLLSSLLKLGLGHADIDVIVLSHLHFDHIGGLFSGWQQGLAPQLLFPNAQFIVGEAHYRHALQPHYRDKASFPADLIDLISQSGRLKLISEESEGVCLPGVSFHFSAGHTPGLMLTELATESGPLVFCSDLIPGQYWVHLPICMGYDRFPEKLIDEKQQLLEYLLQSGGRLFFNHDATMACGKVVKDDRGRFSVLEAKL